MISPETQTAAAVVEVITPGRRHLGPELRPDMLVITSTAPVVPPFTTTATPPDTIAFGPHEQPNSTPQAAVPVPEITISQPPAFVFTGDSNPVAKQTHRGRDSGERNGRSKGGSTFDNTRNDGKVHGDATPPDPKAGEREEKEKKVKKN